MSKYKDEDQDLHDFTKFSEFREPLPPPVKIEEEVNYPGLKRPRAARETMY